MLIFGNAKAMTGTCEMCLREELPLTKHHLIPRSLHKNKQVKRRREREELTTRLLWICRSCHNHLHNVIPIKELEREFDTKEALFAHPEIAKYLRWIRGRKVSGRVAVKKSRRR